MSDGRLTEAELEAIRARDRRDRPFTASDGYALHVYADRAALLTALDAALADLAAAEGALHDLTSPESGEANAAYLRGVEDGVRRCTGVMRKKVESLRKDARKRPDSELAFVYREIVDVLVEIATRIEKEPADG